MASSGTATWRVAPSSTYRASRETVVGRYGDNHHAGIAVRAGSNGYCANGKAASAASPAALASRLIGGNNDR
jgi:hypothetical protein